MKNDCFYILSREPNTPRRGYSSPFDPPRQMWTVLAQPRYLRPPAVKSDECQIRDFLCYFQMKPQTRAAHCVCFYCGNALEDPWWFSSGGIGALLRTTCIHSRSRDGARFSGGRGFSSGAAPWRQTAETRPTLAGEGNFTPVGRTETGINRWIWRYR